MKRIACPCCGYYTIESDDEVIVDICEVCFWQYDETAHKYPGKKIGANNISLNDARINYKHYGVSKQEYQSYVRKPHKEEFPENN
jgi:hypothetical protein